MSDLGFIKHSLDIENDNYSYCKSLLMKYNISVDPDDMDCVDCPASDECEL